VTANAQWNAGLYDEKHSFVWKMAAGLLELLAAQPGERILDLGCGTAHLTSQVAATGALVTGVDRSPEMIWQAREKYPELSFSVMDACEMEFAAPFDAVISNATLHWINQPERAILAIRKALRPGGRFVAEFGGKGNIEQFVAAMNRAWTHLGLQGKPPNPWYYPSIGEYSGLLEKHGFAVTYATLFDRPTPLDDGELGLRNWMDMFGGFILEALPESRREALKAQTEEEARPALFRDGRWVMDYRRLRIVASRIT